MQEWKFNNNNNDNNISFILPFLMIYEHLRRALKQFLRKENEKIYLIFSSFFFTDKTLQKFKNVIVKLKKYLK